MGNLYKPKIGIRRDERYEIVKEPMESEVSDLDSMKKWCRDNFNALVGAAVESIEADIKVRKSCDTIDCNARKSVLLMAHELGCPFDMTTREINPLIEYAYMKVEYDRGFYVPRDYTLEAERH